jgi:hypothetical protein
VWCAARVDNAARVWQVLHQQAGTAGMIEMNMCQEDKVDIGSVEVLLLQRIEKPRHGIVRARVNKSTPAALYDEVTRILQRPEVLGINGENAIAEHRLLTEIIQL